MDKSFKQQMEEYHSPIEWLRENIDDNSEYWEAIEYIGSYSLVFIHQLLKERNKVIQGVKVGFYNGTEFDEETTKYFYESFWDKQNIQEQIENGLRISGWEGKACLTMTPSDISDMSLVVNVPTSITTLEFFGQKLLWIKTIQSYQKGTLVDYKNNEYAVEQKFSEGKINQNFTRKIDNQISITGDTFSKNVSKIQSNRYPVSVKGQIEMNEPILPVVYFEDYPMMNKMGLPLWAEVNPLLIQLDILHIEKYLYVRYNGNKIKVKDFDGDEDDAQEFANEVRSQIRTRYITFFSDYDNFDGEWEWEGADYDQLEKIDNAIDRLEKKIANIIGLEWIFSKEGSFNSTKGETDRMANQQSVVGQNRKWVEKVKKIVKELVDKYIILSGDEKLKDKEVSIFLRETDYSLREFVKDKGLEFIDGGIFGRAELREILLGEAPWEAQRKIEQNISEFETDSKILNPEPEVKSNDSQD